MWHRSLSARWHSWCSSPSLCCRLEAAHRHRCILAYKSSFLPVNMNVFTFHLNCCCLRAVPIHLLYSPLLPAPSFQFTWNLLQGLFAAIVNLPPSLSVTCNQAVICTYLILYQNILDILAQSDF